MRVGSKDVLVCNCEGTMRIDAQQLADVFGDETPVVHTQLCQRQLDVFARSLTSGRPLLVACTQEAPRFEERAASATNCSITYVNIRERAGWSVEGPAAQAKIAALLAEAALDLPPTPSITLKSAGTAVVYGPGETVLECARQLAPKLTVIAVSDNYGDVAPPAQSRFEIYAGRLRTARGYLGKFELTFDGFASPTPSSRASFKFPPGQDGQVVPCDLIIDLSGEARLFPDDRDGYFRAAPNAPQQIQSVLFDAAEMVGEFEKPRYVRVNATLCAHSRSGKVGCTRCLDVCPSGAITPAGDYVSVDPFVCMGHGDCASVCPTSAISYDVPTGDNVLRRLRTLLLTYREAGGQSPVLLVHDLSTGADAINVMARHGRGLPAHVLPFAVNEVSSVGLELLLAAMALGAAQVRIVVRRARGGTVTGTERAVAIAESVAEGLGFGAGRCVLDEIEDPSVLEEGLYQPPPAAIANAAEFDVVGGKRAVVPLALGHLHSIAPNPVDHLPLTAESPFGTVTVDDNCTLCLSCVGACPTQALSDNPDSPQLLFTESLCIQCGLCRSTCPENAIALGARINFTAAAREKRLLREDRPFHCSRCGRAFGTASSITKMVSALSAHPMYAANGRVELLRMCPDCRVAAQFEDEATPMGSRPRPIPRTTDDYLLERDRGVPPKSTH